MIPKDGGNPFSGSAFVGGTNGSWQARQRHRRAARRAASQSGDAVGHITDYNFSIRRADHARQAVVLRAAGADLDQRDRRRTTSSRTGRPASRISGSRTRCCATDLAGDAEEQVHARTTIATRSSRATRWARSPIRTTAARRRDRNHALYYTAQVKWTSTRHVAAAPRGWLLEQHRVLHRSAISPASRRSAARRSGSRQSATTTSDARCVSTGTAS